MCATGIPVSLLINATDLELPGRISRVEFIDLHGDVLMEIPMQLYDTRPALYNVSNIVTPADYFYIKVCRPPRVWNFTKDRPGTSLLKLNCRIAATVWIRVTCVIVA